MRTRGLIIAFVLASAPAPALIGCTCDGRLGGDGASGYDGNIPGFDSAVSGADGFTPPPPGTVVVFAHSASTLYQVDPVTLAVSVVGTFQWPMLPDTMTDIAIDANGLMIGISYDRVYRVDPVTAACTYLADLDRQFNGLSFIPAEQFEPTGAEILMATALDGSVYQLDPLTGGSTPIGAYGGALGSSGDLVSVSGLGTVATVTTGALGAPDSLAWVDPVTGTATVIGSTGVTDIWGVGFWGDSVFGFTDSGEFVLMDVMSGAATVIETGTINWWGAGVTTSAPVIL